MQTTEYVYPRLRVIILMGIFSTVLATATLGLWTLSPSSVSIFAGVVLAVPPLFIAADLKRNRESGEKNRLIMAKVLSFGYGLMLFPFLIQMDQLLLTTGIALIGWLVADGLYLWTRRKKMPTLGTLLA